LGLEERYAQAQQPLSAELAQHGVRRMITACPTCHYRLAHAFPDLQILSIYQLLADERRKISSLSGKIAVHDSCADRTRQMIGGAVRSLIPETQKLKHEGKRSLCCGAGGGVSFSNPELSWEIGRRHWAEIEASEAQMLVTYCTNCAVQLSQTSPGIPVAHILDLFFGLQRDYPQITARIRSLCRDL
jgi:Fe-S oxidoreductase